MASSERLSKEEWAELTAAQVAQAQSALATEVAALQSGEDWKNYLAFQARLHAYSSNNGMLIAAQHAMAYEEGRVPEPLPTYVAGRDSAVRHARAAIRSGSAAFVTTLPGNHDPASWLAHGEGAGPHAWDVAAHHARSPRPIPAETFLGMQTGEGSATPSGLQPHQRASTLIGGRR